MNLDIPKGYNVTQIAYDHDVCCLKAIELLEKMIKGEFIREYSIYIKPTLIPGEKQKSENNEKYKINSQKFISWISFF